VIGSPVEEVTLTNGRRSLMLRVIKFVVRSTSESVIERRVFRSLEGVMEFCRLFSKVLWGAHFYLL